MMFAMAGYFSTFMELFVEAATDPSAADQVEAKIMEMQKDFYDLSSPGAWVIAGGSYLVTILYTAFWTGASGVAYRYIAGTERS